jgi:hypothetical protein
MTTHLTRPVIAAMAAHRINMNAAAARLGISRGTLEYHAAKHGVAFPRVTAGEIRDRVIELAKRGDMTAAQIIQETGVSAPYLRQLKSQHGLTFATTKTRVVRLELPDAMMTWLYSQIPEGGTLADVVRGCVVDAYNEENEG